MRQIDLKATLENAVFKDKDEGVSKVDHIAYHTVRGIDAIRKWIRGYSKIPNTVNIKLIELFNQNDINIIYKEDENS